VLRVYVTVSSKVVHDRLRENRALKNVRRTRPTLREVHVFDDSACGRAC